MTGRNMSQERVKVEGLQVLHTLHAEIYVTNGDIKTWLPLYLVEVNGDIITMPEWLAFARGLI